MTRSPAPAAVALTATLLLLPALSSRAQPQAPAPYTVLGAATKGSLPVRSVGGQEMFPLDELARLFGLTIREDTLAGGLVVSTKEGQTITLTPNGPLVSVGGRVLSLSAPAARDGRSWYVPPDFIPRALGPALGTRLELRRASRLLVVGDLAVPRVTARLDAEPGRARVTLQVTPSTPHTVTREDGRLVVRFDAPAIDATLPSSSDPELVEQIRPLEGGAGVAIDLGPRVASFRTTEAPTDRGGDQINLELLAADAPPAPVAAAPPPPAADPGPLLGLAPPGALRTIVIDPGHGGEDAGARGPGGTAEKDVTLAVARRLKGAIEARLGARVILTRDRDQTVGLDERAAVANNNKADLFISLHANASARPALQGAGVYYLSLDDYGDEAQQEAQRQHASLPVLGGGMRDIEVIPWELAQAGHIDESARLAGLVEAALRERVPMSPRALQQAPMRVLVGANMPAVLVEMGFVSNPEQEKQLASDAFQATLTASLLDSIIRFRDARAASAQSAAAAPGAVR